MMRGHCHRRLLPTRVVALGLALFAALDFTWSQESVGVSRDRLDRIDRVVRQGIARGNMAGCVVLIGHRKNVVFHRAYGHRQLEPEPLPMTTDTVFDLASLTKPLATATSIMLLVQRDRLKLEDPASKYLSSFRGHRKEAITISQLLTHQSGLLPDNAMRDYHDGPEEAFRKIDALELRAAPGERFIYSDVGYIVLARVIKAISGLDVHRFTQREFFGPLKMEATGFLPSDVLKARCAVTEQRSGRWLRGEVHDPRAHGLGGIAGHAGLFSTASDLNRLALMLLNGGSLEGQQYFEPETIQQMVGGVRTSGGIRSHGWDVDSVYSSNRGDLMSDSAFGHGGFTGTAMWIDPEQELVVIFLSNRLHPDGKGSVNSIAGRIGTIAAAAID